MVRRSWCCASLVWIDWQTGWRGRRGQGKALVGFARRQGDGARARASEGADHGPGEAGAALGVQGQGRARPAGEPIAAQAEGRGTGVEAWLFWMGRIGRRGEAEFAAPVAGLADLHQARLGAADSSAGRQHAPSAMAELELQLIAQGAGDEVVGGVAVADLDDVDRTLAPPGLDGVQRPKHRRQDGGVAEAVAAGLGDKSGGEGGNGQGGQGQAAPRMVLTVGRPADWRRDHRAR